MKVIERTTDSFDSGIDRTAGVVVAMAGLDALWWILLHTGSVPMPGMMWLTGQMAIPMAAPGAMELAVFHLGTATAVIEYLVMWGVMMWAMMYVPMMRFTRDYVDALRGSTLDVVGTAALFLVGYSLIWALSGSVPLGLHAALPDGIYGFTRAHTQSVVGGALVLTGLYQLSAFKRSQLRTCCSRVAPQDARPLDGLREGVSHGVGCILVCFGPFFLLMPFFGEMNYFWMVALTTVVTVERLPPTWGTEFSTATGVVALLAGVGVLLLRPSLPVAFTM